MRLMSTSYLPPYYPAGAPGLLSRGVAPPKTTDKPSLDTFFAHVIFSRMKIHTVTQVRNLQSLAKTSLDHMSFSQDSASPHRYYRHALLLCLPSNHLWSFISDGNQPLCSGVDVLAYDGGNTRPHLLGCRLRIYSSH